MSSVSAENPAMIAAAAVSPSCLVVITPALSRTVAAATTAPHVPWGHPRPESFGSTALLAGYSSRGCAHKSGGSQKGQLSNATRPAMGMGNRRTARPVYAGSRAKSRYGSSIPGSNPSPENLSASTSRNGCMELKSRTVAGGPGYGENSAHRGDHRDPEYRTRHDLARVPHRETDQRGGQDRCRGEKGAFAASGSVRDRHPNSRCRHERNTPNRNPFI